MLPVSVKKDRIFDNTFLLDKTRPCDTENVGLTTRFVSIMIPSVAVITLADAQVVTFCHKAIVVAIVPKMTRF